MTRKHAKDDQTQDPAAAQEAQAENDDWKPPGPDPFLAPEDNQEATQQEPQVGRRPGQEF